MHNYESRPEPTASRLRLLLGHVADLRRCRTSSSRGCINAWNARATMSGHPPRSIDYAVPVRRRRSNLTVTKTRVNAYYCPTDGGNLNLIGGAGWPVTSQNYVANFGSTSSDPEANHNGVPFLGAPFTDMGTRSSPTTASRILRRVASRSFPSTRSPTG